MLLLCFAVVLLLAVLVSSLAHRTILSTAVLVAGCAQLSRVQRAIGRSSAR